MFITHFLIFQYWVQSLYLTITFRKRQLRKIQNFFYLPDNNISVSQSFALKKCLIPSSNGNFSEKRVNHAKGSTLLYYQDFGSWTEKYIKRFDWSWRIVGIWYPKTLSCPSIYKSLLIRVYLQNWIKIRMCKYVLSWYSSSFCYLLLIFFMFPTSLANGRLRNCHTLKCTSHVRSCNVVEMKIA